MVFRYHRSSRQGKRTSSLTYERMPSRHQTDRIFKMQKRLSTRLQSFGDRLAQRNSSRPEVDYLCKSCHNLILTNEHLRDIPISPLPNGSVALDLPQTQLHVSATKKDTYPSFQGLMQAAATGCEFCALLYDTISRHQDTDAAEWQRLVERDNTVVIDFRYECAPELGLRSLGPGEWPTMLSTLQATIKPSNDSNCLRPIVLIFRVFCDPGMMVVLSCKARSLTCPRICSRRLSQDILEEAEALHNFSRQCRNDGKLDQRVSEYSRNMCSNDARVSKHAVRV